jgi:thioesterase domain-containing protein
MTEIWCEVLGLEQVSVLDDFFELGGHSLSATRLIARLRSTLAMDLPLRSIFLDPTIAGLSSHIVYDGAAKTYRYTSEIPKWKCLVPAQPKGARTPLFFVGGANAGEADDILLFLSQLFPRFKKDQPIYGLCPRSADGVSEGYSSVGEAAREFLSEVRAVQPKGPYLLGGHCVGGIAAIEIAKLLMQEGEEVRLLVMVDTVRPSPMRGFGLELHFRKEKVKHFGNVFSQILHAGRQQRSEMIADLIRRKVKSARPERIQNDRYYASMVQYRRLMNKHTIAHYPGRLTLIVNRRDASINGTLGWQGVAQGGLDVRVLPGDHLTLVTDHGTEVGDLILKSIEGAFAEDLRSAESAEVKAS